MNSQSIRNFKPALLAAFMTAAAGHANAQEEVDTKTLSPQARAYNVAKARTDASKEELKSSKEELKSSKEELRAAQAALAKVEADQAARVKALKETKEYKFSEIVCKEIEGKKGKALKDTLMAIAERARKSPEKWDDPVVAATAESISKTGFSRRRNEFSKQDTADVIAVLSKAPAVEKAAQKEETKAKNPEIKGPKISRAEKSGDDRAKATMLAMQAKHSAKPSNLALSKRD